MKRNKAPSLIWPVRFDVRRQRHALRRCAAFAAWHDLKCLHSIPSVADIGEPTARVILRQLCKHYGMTVKEMRNNIAR
jgi:hypothetical protein